MEAPVEEGGLQGLARGGRRGRHGRGRLEEMLQRLAHAEVHQADAHAGGEQHGGPGDEAELGLRIIGPQADVAEAAGRDEDQKDQEQRDRDGIEPVQVPHHPGLGAGEQPVGAVGHEAAVQQQQAQHQQGRNDDGARERDARCRLCRRWRGRLRRIRWRSCRWRRAGIGVHVWHRPSLSCDQWCAREPIRNGGGLALVGRAAFPARGMSAGQRPQVS